MTQAVRYLENAIIKTLIQSAPHYRKSAETLLRLPRGAEQGSRLETFVKDAEGVRRESVSVIGEDHVIARNPTAIGEAADGSPIYNEWPVTTATIIKNYGQNAFDALTTEFSAHKKSATVQALVLEPSMILALGQTGDILHIHVDWSDEPMIAKVGDFLTSGGYSISAHDMSSYELA